MAKSQALNILQEIKSATFQNAAPLPLKETVQPEWQGLGFQIGGVKAVAPMGEIAEILKVPKMATLPSVKSWVLGIANIRGRLIPIIDLHEFMHLQATLPKSEWRVLVVEDDDLVAGFLVEQSLGIQHFLEDSFEDEIAAEGIETLRPYLKGTFRHGGRVFYEARLKSILRDDRFFDVQEPTS